jgi:hypothetical protein
MLHQLPGFRNADLIPEGRQIIDACLDGATAGDSRGQ